MTILWKDFILDDFFGPSLNFENESPHDRREARTGSPQHRQEDDGGTQASQTIQETGQMQRPARMVGFSSLDSRSGRGDPTGMEAGGEPRKATRRLRGGTG